MAFVEVNAWLRCVPGPAAGWANIQQIFTMVHLRTLLLLIKLK
jgi:hypothetical protein